MTFILAEVAQNHEGSLGIAQSFIDAISERGADAVKFQTHLADEESTSDEKFRIEMSGQDSSRYEYWKRMQFTREQWLGLASRARDRGLEFVSSAFCAGAVDILKDTGMARWKISSGEVFSEKLLELIVPSAEELIVSTGMSSWDDIDDLVGILESTGVPFTLLQCTSMYPTPLSKVGLNVIDEFRDRYGCRVGLSDHSGNIHVGLAAICRNVDLLEIHVTFHKSTYGPDVSSSLDLDDLEFLVSHRDVITDLNQYSIDKNQIAQELLPTKRLFSKSLCLRAPKVEGDVIYSEDLVEKKPGTGISVDSKADLVGKKLMRDVPADRLLRWSDFGK